MTEPLSETVMADLLRGAATRTLADIWATVDLERALAERGLFPNAIAAAVDTAAHDPLLGGRVALLDGGHAHRVEERQATSRLAIAEPTTEGRLAAHLARHGEGPAGRYVEASADLDGVVARAAAAGIAIRRGASGPFGPAILVLSAGDGPLLILVGSTAVPSPR